MKKTSDNHKHANERLAPAATISAFHWALFVLLSGSFSYFSMLQSSRCHKNLDFETGFNATKAIEHLINVTSYGDRTAGSYANQFLAHNYIKKQLEEIVGVTKRINIELDDQVVYPSNFRAHNHVTSYSGLSNIVVRLSESKGPPSKKSLLVNCHYDTPVNSPGASDVFVSCATMIETIRVLSTGQYKLPHDLIFLLNGAEESILPASHAFITQHKWSKNIAAFINLEGCGSGGRMVVFQTGPGIASQLFVDAFSRSLKNPSANIAGEELFQSGLLPADTDFRIFRDYGRIPGIDMAYISDGYVYHTEHDVPNRIEKNCVELAGENLVLLVIELISSNKFDDLQLLNPEINLPTDFYNDKMSEANSIAMFSEPHRHKLFSSSNRYVYFDFLGYFVVRMPFTLSKIITVLVTMLLFFHMYRTRQSYLSYASTKQKLCGILLAFTLNILFVLSLMLLLVIIGFCTSIFGIQMTWYAKRYNLICLYVLPSLCFLFYFHSYLFGLCYSKSLLFKWPFSYLTKNVYWIIPKKDKSVKNIPEDEKDLRIKSILEDFNDASLLVHSIVLYLMLSEGIATSYVFYLWILIPLIGSYIHKITKSGSSFLHMLLFIVPHASFYHSYTISIILIIFIPITGRSGQGLSSDLLVSVIMFILTFPILNVLVAYVRVTKTKHIRVLFKVLFSMCCVVLFLLKFSAMGFPYSVKSTENVANGSSPSAQQRMHIIHVNTILHENSRNMSEVTMKESSMLMYTIDSSGYKFLQHDSKPEFLSSIFDDSPYDHHLKPMPEGHILTCNYSLPYCGVPYHYPFANVFGTGYKVPVDTFHKSSPDPQFKIVKKSVVTENDMKLCERQLPAMQPDFIRFNISISVTNGPPHTHFFMRTEPQFVRLIGWSFDKNAGYPQPMYMPYPEDTSELSKIGAHYFISHINGQAAVTNSGINNRSEWSTPLIFWLIFDVKSDSVAFRDDCVDFTLSANYFDPLIENSGRSGPLKDFLKYHIPPWITPTPYVTTYSHYKYSLKK